MLVGAKVLVDKLDQDLLRLHQISFDEYVVLVALSEHPEGMRIDRLGSVLVSPTRLPRLVTHLQLAGHVTRDAASGRGSDAWVRITPRGRAVVDRAAPDHVASVRTHLIDLVDRDDFLAVARVFAQVAGVATPTA